MNLKAFIRNIEHAQNSVFEASFVEDGDDVGRKISLSKLQSLGMVSKQQR